MRTRPGFSGSLPATGWSSSCPKCRANATCSARVMSWSRKKRTLCLRSKARISATRSASREATPRFTLLSSAPMLQVSCSTLIELFSAPARTTAGAPCSDLVSTMFVIACSPARSRATRLDRLERSGAPCTAAHTLRRLRGRPRPSPPRAEGAAGGPGRADPGSAGRLEQAEELGAADDVLARAGGELAEQVLEVPLDSLLAHFHGEGDLLVREVAGEQLENLPFLWSEHHARDHSRGRCLALCGHPDRAARRESRAGGVGCSALGCAGAPRPVAERGMGIDEEPRETVGFGEVGRLLEEREAVLGVAVQGERTQRHDLDAYAPEVQRLGEGACALQDLDRTGPVLRRDGGVGPGERSPHFHAALPELALRKVIAREELVDLRAQRAARLGAEPPRVQADLVSQAGDA